MIVSPRVSRGETMEHNDTGGGGGRWAVGDGRCPRHRKPVNSGARHMGGTSRATSVLGKRNVKVAPRSSLFDAHMRPPCPSTIERQMERPSPRPCAFDVMKGSNTESTGWRLIPAPQSDTDTRTAAPSFAVAIQMCRSVGGLSLIASHALTMRF